MPDFSKAKNRLETRLACRSVCDRDQKSWSVKIVLDRLIAPFRGSWSLDSTGVQRTKCSHAAKYLRKCVDRLILVAQNSSWSLDRLQKRTLIAWFHFDPGRKRFYSRRVCDYPLWGTKTRQSLWTVTVDNLWAALTGNNHQVLQWHCHAKVSAQMFAKIDLLSLLHCWERQQVWVSFMEKVLQWLQSIIDQVYSIIPSTIQ